MRSTWPARFSSSIRPRQVRHGAGLRADEAVVLEPPAAEGDPSTHEANLGPAQAALAGRDDPSRLLRQAAVLCTHQDRDLFVARAVALSGTVAAAASTAALVFGIGDPATGGAGLAAAQTLLAVGAVQLAIGAIGLIRVERKIRDRLLLWRTETHPLKEAADDVIRLSTGTKRAELAQRLRNNT